MDLGPIDVDTDEENRKQADYEKFAGQNNSGPTLVLSSGYFSNLQGERIAQWVARLGCGTCGFHKIYDNWAQMTSNIPNECQAKELYDDCPMRRGKMMRQYQARQ